MIDDENGSRQAAHDLELWLIAALEQLPGASAAAVWLADLKRIRAVHITAAHSASVTILANAAARVLRKHGLEFTPDAIRVIVEEPVEPSATRDSAPTAAPTHVRLLLLHDLSIQRAGSRVTCTVQVERGPDIFEGQAVELDTEAGRARAAARATLSAAESANESLALGLEGTLVLDLFGRRYIATSVEAAVHRRFGLLAGLVPVDPSRSLEEAACLAALRAIDRWIAW
jgi:hypothetical protein